jgi:hypothetical protein
VANVRRINTGLLFGSAEVIEVRIDSGCEAHAKMGGGGGNQTTVNDSLTCTHVLMPELHCSKRRFEFSNANVQEILLV